MARIVTIINQKGGVGKTTTAFQIATILERLKCRVLVIDMDPQANLTTVLKANKNSYSILDVLLKNVSASDAIQHLDSVDVLISNGNLSSYDMRFQGKDKEYRLKEVLEPIKKYYDFIIIDSPPSLSILTVSILTASDSFIITAAPDMFSIEGIRQIYDTYKAVKTYTNKELIIDGILLTRVEYDIDHDISKMIKELANELNIKVFDTMITEEKVVKDSLMNSTSLIDFAPKSKAFANYLMFIKEFVTNISEQKKGELNG